MVYLDRKLACVIARGNRVLYWHGVIAVTFDLIDIRQEPAVPERLLPALARLGRESGVTFAAVDEGKRGLLFIDGRLDRVLGPGTHGPRIEVLEVSKMGPALVRPAPIFW